MLGSLALIAWSCGCISEARLGFMSDGYVLRDTPML